MTHSLWCMLITLIYWVEREIFEEKDMLDASRDVEIEVTSYVSMSPHQITGSIYNIKAESLK